VVRLEKKVYEVPVDGYRPEAIYCAPDPDDSNGIKCTLGSMEIDNTIPIMTGKSIFIDSGFKGCEMIRTDPKRPIIRCSKHF